MADDFDPFAPGSNLKEDYDGIVKWVAFEKSAQGDNYTAHVVVQADDGEEVESFLSLGKDWVSYDGGRSVEHPRGNRTKFNAQTTYSEFVSFAMGGFDGDKTNPDAKPAEKLGAAEVLRERNRRLENRGPQYAELWEGLRFHWDVLVRNGRQRKGDEWVDAVVERMLPVRFLGDVGVQGVQQQLPTTEVGTSAPVTPQTPQTPVQNVQHVALASLTPADQQRVIALAQQQDFGGFVDGVMALPKEGGGSMMDVGALIQALSDEQFYQSLRGQG